MRPTRARTHTHTHTYTEAEFSGAGRRDADTLPLFVGNFADLASSPLPLPPGNVKWERVKITHAHLTPAF